jgi:hypothetical protein
MRPQIGAVVARRARPHRGKDKLGRRGKGGAQGRRGLLARSTAGRVLDEDAFYVGVLWSSPGERVPMIP